MENKTEVKLTTKLEAKAILRNIKELLKTFLGQLYNIFNCPPPHRLFSGKKKGKGEEE